MRAESVGPGFTCKDSPMKPQATTSPAQPAPSGDLPADSDRLLTQEEVQEMLSVSRPSLQRLVAAGGLQKVPLGARLVRYRLSDVQRIVRDGYRR
jgi:excisionase family DNA binding protein